MLRLLLKIKIIQDKIKVVISYHDMLVIKGCFLGAVVHEDKYNCSGLWLCQQVVDSTTPWQRGVPAFTQSWITNWAKQAAVVSFRHPRVHQFVWDNLINLNVSFGSHTIKSDEILYAVRLHPHYLNSRPWLVDLACVKSSPEETCFIFLNKCVFVEIEAREITN